MPVGAEMGARAISHTSPRGGLHVRPPVPSEAHLENAALGVDVGHPEHDDGPPVVVHCGARGSERGLTARSPGALAVRGGPQGPCWVPRDGGKGRPLCVQDGGWVGEVPSGNRNGHTGREGQVHSPKSIPSDTLPRATESRMAPRPFSQAWGGKARTQTRHQGAVPPLAPLRPNSPCPPSTHLLVLLQGNAGLSPILGLDEEQLVPLDVLQDALQGGQGEVRMWAADGGFKDGGVLLKLSSATLSPGLSLPSGDQGRVVAGSSLTSLENPVIPGGNQSPSSGQVGQAGGPGDPSGCSTPSL